MHIFFKDGNEYYQFDEKLNTLDRIKIKTKI